MEAGNQIFFALVEEQLAEGRQVKIALKGTSMLPTLHEGDTLTLCPLSHDPEVGDVVLFRYGGGHRLHNRGNDARRDHSAGQAAEEGRLQYA